MISRRFEVRLTFQLKSKLLFSVSTVFITTTFYAPMRLINYSFNFGGAHGYVLFMCSTKREQRRNSLPKLRNVSYVTLASIKTICQLIWAFQRPTISCSCSLKQKKKGSNRKTCYYNQIYTHSTSFTMYHHFRRPPDFLTALSSFVLSAVFVHFYHSRNLQHIE